MKAILVIDMPKDCPYCPMAHWNKLDEFTGCDAVGDKKYAIIDEEYAKSSCRPSWCPLRPFLLGQELRKFRKTIKDKNTLIGFNMAVAICNKHLGDIE